jgi:PAS domain S-box-containing protein
MPKIIKILHLEDVRSDAEMVKRAMRHEHNFEWLWVSNKADFQRALDEYIPDIILCDHSLPGFDSVQAFLTVKEHGLKVPFILITGTISEDFAVMMMKEGVSDYLLKDRIQRLPAAITHALEKRQAEREKETHLEAITRSEANLIAIIENSDVSIYSLDKDFRYITFNSLLKKALKEAYGLNIRIGDNVYDFLGKLDPTEANKWERRYKDAFSGKSLQFEEEFQFNDFHTVTSFSINPIWEGAKVTGLSCFAHDITKQRAADEKIKQSEARFRALIENNYDAIILRDRDLNTVYHSPSANKMIGYGPDEIIPASLYDSVHPNDIASLKEAFVDVLANPGRAIHLEVRALHKDGHYIWVEGFMRNLLDNENVRGIIFNYRDISEQKASDLHREKMIADITLRIRDLEQFAYIVSHNLRAPVANILGISNVLEFPDLPETEKAQALVGITLSAKKLDEVIIDLNSILQMKEEISENKQMVSFKALVDDIQSSIAGLVKNDAVKIITDFANAAGLTTIKSYLYSIFYNLISNSLKYKRVGTPLVIEIKSFLSNGKTGLSFKDNGIGIDLSKHGSELFGLYKRFHLGSEGKGIGLFMVKSQVDALQGTIIVRSELNTGTEFIINL